MNDINNWTHTDFSHYCVVLSIL